MNRYYYGKVKYDLRRSRFDANGHNWYYIEFIRNTSIYNDKEMRDKDITMPFKKGDYQISRSIGLNGKGYFMHEFISRNGNKYYYPYFIDQ